jgi:hypothetical protein
VIVMFLNDTLSPAGGQACVGDLSYPMSFNSACMSSVALRDPGVCQSEFGFELTMEHHDA